MIETSNLTRRFGNIVAVEDLSLSIGEGEVFGLLGPNGAGKTTTVRVLCCLISPTSGSAFIDGIELGTEEAGEQIRSRIGLLPENPGLYDNLTAAQNLRFYASINDVPHSKIDGRIKELLTMLDIWNERDRPVATFSKGMKQKIAIARALVHDPKILFLDEPTAGLDPAAAKVVRDFIEELSKERRTVFINTHNLFEAERLCDRVGILKRKLLALGTPDELPKRLWKSKVQIRTAAPVQIDREGLLAIKGVSSFKAENKEITIEVDDPEQRLPEIVELLVKSGARIIYAGELKRSLEESYLEYVGASS
ncbi:MAG: ABC transporter ATP-binding protein [Thermoplasmata archaeon]